ncbi:hypothetical protein AXG93_3661s1010 [Marchantia polymorpha subsp. ruderalis]|uniref:Uncharacterized protein n=1 Tax=Marchantia polymorpha subsp. ruderalis TaxID=1480154 RepID=A0A176VMR9_MARPO|nr:hypothetical protein AXG93_3661s1010 [Marchantia polymorpha subsp. ruderalis]
MTTIRVQEGESGVLATCFDSPGVKAVRIDSDHLPRGKIPTARRGWEGLGTGRTGYATLTSDGLAWPGLPSLFGIDSRDSRAANDEDVPDLRSLSRLMTGGQEDRSLSAAAAAAAATTDAVPRRPSLLS